MVFVNGVTSKWIDLIAQFRIRAFVSGSEFDRNMSQIVAADVNAKTATFPNTARRVLDRAFADTSLRSAVLNEGLERLGGHREECRNRYVGVFCNTKIQKITLPSTLRVLEDDIFDNCRELKSVTFREGSRLEEITIPSSVITILDEAFSNCKALTKISF